MALAVAAGGRFALDDDDDRDLKVTDRRPFDAAGELREEFKPLDEEAAAPEPSPSPEPAPAPPPAEEPPPDQSERGERDFGEPTFADLVAILAEPIGIYLGDAKLPDGRSAENLEAARLHIELLGVVKEKTDGNLSSQEAAFLEDLLYQLRLRYVQKSG